MQQNLFTLNKLKEATNDATIKGTRSQLQKLNQLQTK